MLKKKVVGLAFWCSLLNVLALGLIITHGSFTALSTTTLNEPSLQLLGAGARWAAGEGNRALYVNWFDNLMAHPNDLAPDKQVCYSTRVSISLVLEEYGFDVSYAGDIPDDPSAYDLLFIDSYWACEPSNEPIIRNYVSGGGGLVLTAGVPVYFATYCKDFWPGGDLGPVQEWFGAGLYVNTGGYARLTVDHPFGTQMSEGETVYVAHGQSLAAVTSLQEDASLVANWDTGCDFAFIHTYGNGRVYYQAAYRTPTPLAANFTWTPEMVEAGQPVTFDASTSQSAWNGTYETPITEYRWDFGDGNTTSSVNAAMVHTYASASLVEVTLTVFDADGTDASCYQTIQVEVRTFLSISTSTASTFVGYAVGINGALCDAFGNGLEGETVVLSYTFQGAWAWYPISSAPTDSLGQYGIQWMPTATGTFTIKAEWWGNEEYRAAQSTVTLSTLPYMNKYIFTVESSSQIAALAFNTTSRELRFTASGQEGTKGYAKVTIAKTLVDNATDVRVYLDGNQVEYSLTSLDDSWLLSFEYTHSTHQVAVNLNIGVVPEFPSATMLALLMTIASIVAVVIKKKQSKRL